QWYISNEGTYYLKGKVSFDSEVMNCFIKLRLNSYHENHNEDENEWRYTTILRNFGMKVPYPITKFKNNIFDICCYEDIKGMEFQYHNFEKYNEAHYDMLGSIKYYEDDYLMFLAGEYLKLLKILNLNKLFYFNFDAELLTFHESEKNIYFTDLSYITPINTS